MNKKISNATQVTNNGIDFKSKSESMVYKTLVQLGFNPQYEPVTYLLWTGFVPTVPFLTKNKFKRKDHRITPLSKNTCIDNRPPTGITYTPDFEFDAYGKHIIIEVKGFENDVFPYKFKMFRNLLEQHPNKNNIELWEIFTKKQLLECVEHLKQQYEETQ